MALVDSGSELTIISKSICHKLGFKVIPERGRMHGAFAGMTTPRIGHTMQHLAIGNVPIETKLEVAELQQGVVDMILGADLFQSFGIYVAGVPCAWPGQDGADDPVVLTAEEERLARAYIPDDVEEVPPAEKQLVMDSLAAIRSA